MDVTYYFARLNLIAVYADKKKFLLDGLNSGTIKTFRGYNWGYSDIQEIKQGDEEFITGFLVKYEELGAKEVIDEESHQIDTAEVKNMLTAKSRFFIHINSGLVAYNVFGNIINQESFCNRFVEIFVEAYQGFFMEAKMYTVEEDIKFADIVKRFTAIKKITFKLHPSNPSFRERWKNIDERMKAIGVSEYQETYVVKKEKGALKIDPEIENKVVMAEDGYGEATISGTLDDGTSDTVSTKDNPATSTAPGNDEAPEPVLDKLSTKMVEIFSRFKK